VPRVQKSGTLMLSVGVPEHLLFIWPRDQTLCSCFFVCSSFSGKS